MNALLETAVMPLQGRAEPESVCVEVVRQHDYGVDCEKGWRRRV
jgi:hypothetical protein